jgi:hypothetical protein
MFTSADYGLQNGPATYKRLCSFRGNGPCDGDTSTTNPANDSAGPMPAYMESEFRRFVAGLMQIQTSSLEQRMLIALPFKGEPAALPDHGQIALLQDDKHGAQVVLRGGTSLRTDKLDARLCLGSQAKPEFLMPLSVAAEDNGQNVVVNFPPLQKNSLIKRGDLLALRVLHGKVTSTTASACDCANVANSTAISSPVKTAVTTVGSTSAQIAEIGPVALCDRYVLTLVPTTKPDEENPLKVTAMALVTDSSGNARVAITPGAATGVYVRVSGGELRSSDPAIQFNAKLNAYLLPTGTVTVLNLANLTPAQNVSLYGITGDKVIGSPIVLPVQMAPLEARP